MLRLSGGTDAQRLWNKLFALFQENAMETTYRRLTTPGGSVDGAEVHWVALGDGHGIWAHFRAPEPNEDRWWCWFGVDLGQTKSEALVPAVEINLPKKVPTKVVVFQCPCGTAVTRRRPRLARP